MFLKGSQMSVKAVVLNLLLVIVVTFAGCQKPSLENSIAALQAKIEKDFANADLHYQLGQLYQQQGNWDKASYEFNNALNFDPVNRDAQASMVKVLQLKGDQAQAAEVAKNYLKQTSILPEDSLALGRAFEVHDVSDYALAAYEQALKLAPKSAIPPKQIAYYYLAKKDKAMAETYFRRSFELDPYQSDVALELGRLGIKVSVPKAPAQQAAPKK
jgi:Tfp pilus assembly protein PilF